MINIIPETIKTLQDIRRVPEEYLPEFLEEQTAFIKKRVRLLCISTVGIYFFALFTWFLIQPDEFSIFDIVIGLFLVSGGSFILYLNSRTRNIITAKLNAYLFTVFLMALLVKLGIVYQDEPMTSSALFVFTLFFISITIPWAAIEVIFLGIIHGMAYTASFFLVKHLAEMPKTTFTLQNYLEGFLFMFMALVLCVVVRRQESRRDVSNFVLFKEVEDRNEQMRKELEWATRVHMTVISNSATTGNADIAVNYLPVYYIGGDYVRFNFLDPDHLIFIISDITGHGVPAALLVNRMHAEFERLAKENRKPGKLLKELNVFIKEDFEGSDMYLSAFCGYVDFKNMQMLYSNYGHPPQYLYRSGEKKICSLPAQTSLLGLPVNDDGVYQEEIEIGEKDKIVLFTDGVTETDNGKGEQYGEQRVKEFLERNHGLTCSGFNKKLLKELNSFKTDKFKDDVCLMSIGIKAHASIFTLGSHIIKHYHHDEE